MIGSLFCKFIVCLMMGAGFVQGEKLSTHLAKEDTVPVASAVPVRPGVATDALVTATPVKPKKSSSQESLIPDPEPLSNDTESIGKIGIIF